MTTYRPLRKAVIMAGGFGTRLKELTKDTPKPMLRLQGKPILEYAIEMCKRYGITEIAISVFYLGDKIKEHFGDGSRYGVKIIYFEEPEPLGTAGVLRLYKDWLDETFLMCNADELKDINLHAMYEQHIRTGALVTDALTRVDDPTQYGVAELSGNKIVRFVEKPKAEEAPSDMINAGLYLIEPSVVSMVPAGFCMIEKEIFPKLAAAGKLYGFVFGGQWYDTGTPERYAQAESEWRGFKEQPYLSIIGAE